jgi:hypothetical protein
VIGDLEQAGTFLFKLILGFLREDHVIDMKIHLMPWLLQKTQEAIKQRESVREFMTSELKDQESDLVKNNQDAINNEK